MLYVCTANKYFSNVSVFTFKVVTNKLNLVLQKTIKVSAKYILF